MQNRLYNALVTDHYTTYKTLLIQLNSEVVTGSQMLLLLTFT